LCIRINWATNGRSLF